MYTLGAYTLEDKQKAERTIHMFSIDRYFSAKTSSANIVLYRIWTAKEQGEKNQNKKPTAIKSYRMQKG